MKFQSTAETFLFWHYGSSASVGAVPQYWTLNSYCSGDSTRVLTRSVPACPTGQVLDPTQPSATACSAPSPTCPAAGTDAGTQNITSGWINSTEYSVEKVIDSPRPAVVVVDSCKVSVGAPVACYQSIQPTANGLYRLSCDFQSTYTGESGSPSTDTPSLQPSPAAPPCPGTSGEINGKPVCLAPKVPSEPLPKVPQTGNPPTGSGGAPTSFDPSTGAGSNSPVGSAGVAGGTTVAVVGGSGGSNVTVNIPEIAMCGSNGNPPCKIDEAGTPTDGTAAFTDANTALDTAVTTYTEKFADVVSDGDKDASWGWLPALPQGSCTPIQFASLGEVNWCHSAASIEQVMTFMWSFITVFCLLGMVSRAIKGA